VRINENISCGISPETPAATVLIHKPPAKELVRFEIAKVL